MKCQDKKLHNDFYKKYLKYKSKYLDLKKTQSISKLFGGDRIKYVVSSHGSMDTAINDEYRKPQTFLIPNGFTLHTFVPIGETLYCSNTKPNRVCNNSDKPLESYKDIRFPNYILQSDLINSGDKKPAFFSGVKRCNGNKVIFNIDTIYSEGQKYVFLEDIINNILHDIKSIPFVTADVYLLFCLGGLGNNYVAGTEIADPTDDVDTDDLDHDEDM